MVPHFGGRRAVAPASIELQPPATAGMMLTSSLAATGVARSSR